MPRAGATRDPKENKRLFFGRCRLFDPGCTAGARSMASVEFNLLWLPLRHRRDLTANFQYASVLVNHFPRPISLANVARRSVMTKPAKRDQEGQAECDRAALGGQRRWPRATDPIRPDPSDGAKFYPFLDESWSSGHRIKALGSTRIGAVPLRQTCGNGNSRQSYAR